jgi:hypothetical protein
MESNPQSAIRNRLRPEADCEPVSARTLSKNHRLNKPDRRRVDTMTAFDVRTLGWARLAVLASLCVLPASVQDVHAQVLYGSLVGSVRDQTKAAIPGADVTIVHRETGRARTGISNELGYFDFASITTGVYEVRVGMAGFKSFVRADVAVSLNSVTRVDAVLEVGEVSEQVTVTGRAAALQTESAEVKAEISDAKLVNLPIPLGRNW